MQNQPLSRAFNIAVNHIANRVLPCGFDVLENAPNSYESLRGDFERTGRIRVWGGGSENTIFACPDTNFAFRAWHDSKHVLYRLPFDRAGEYAAYVYQCRDICALYDGRTAETFCRILSAEICGQFEYSERFGGFPIDQIGFARAYLGNAENPGMVPSPLAAPARFGISTAGAA